MNAYVLDTSVAIAWYLNESFSPAARSWQNKLFTGKISILTPSLHFLEFANVMRTLVIRKELDANLAQNIYDIHLDAPLEHAEPDERDILNTALAYNATAYDSVYIALSISRGIPLITAERTTTEWVKKMKDQAIIISR